MPICFAVAGAGLSLPVRAATPAQEIADAKVAIDAANGEWPAAMRMRDAARIAAPYADDGLFIAPDGEVVRGRSAIERMLADYLATADRLVSATIRSDGLQYSGGSIIEWGHGEVSREGKDGRVKSATSHYLTIWHRGDRGVWRIRRNILL